MLGIHPIRWTRRLLRGTVRKVIALVIVMSGAGLGGAHVHSDLGLGREAAAFVKELIRNESPTNPHPTR